MISIKPAGIFYLIYKKNKKIRHKCKFMLAKTKKAW